MLRLSLLTLLAVMSCVVSCSGVHKCFNNAESYTAGWLARSDMVLRAKFEGVSYGGTYDPASVYG